MTLSLKAKTRSIFLLLLLCFAALSGLAIQQLNSVARQSTIMTTIWTMVQSWMESRLGDRRAAETPGGFWQRLRSNVFSMRNAAGGH